MKDIAPRVHQFLATLTAAPAATVKIADLWASYRAFLSAAERRRTRRRDFVAALRSGGPLALGHHSELRLLGFSIDKPAMLAVDPTTKRIVRN